MKWPKRKRWRSGSRCCWRAAPARSWRLGRSPAIDAAAGSFLFVTDDIDGQPRSKPDLGAQERADGAGKDPLTAPDVGPDAP